ncbi:Inward rectifier potassium channel [Operophtera brumata]|uniref:Inward rectifier potassium channel n=1 Tax=Operophtera brumata TaxID=104452 RepID=A0A0L7KNH9_OPEBR|nr:Inward rectifier potassium channel [Operophtera brumata]
MEAYAAVTKQISVIEEKPEENLELIELIPKEKEFEQIYELYDECLTYLKQESVDETTDSIDPDYESIEEKYDVDHHQDTDINHDDVDIVDEMKKKMVYKIENELISNESINTITSEPRSERLRKLSQQLPKIIITQSNTSLNIRRHDNLNIGNYGFKRNDKPRRPGQTDLPKRLVSKRGIENVALISNVPFERIRLLNDTFHTLINLRWRWIVSGTIVVHFAIWLVFAVFWYIAALAHYDFEPDPPKRTCVTGGHDFLTIFLASVEAQLILGTGLSGVLTCVVYAKLTRPEKLTKEGEVIRYYAQTLALQQRQFLLWPVTLLHVIDQTSPLYGYSPQMVANNNYEITVSLKGASASMGTFTQSQTSYLPKEVSWGHRFPPVVKRASLNI